MPEVAVAALDASAQAAVARARLALEQGAWDYVVAVTSAILRDVPGCLEVRQLRQDAWERQPVGAWCRWQERVLALPGVALWRRLARKPSESWRGAERLLHLHPRSVVGLQLLADAAARHDCPATVCWAWQTLREARPGELRFGLGLTSAWLAAGQPEQAVALAEALLREYPHEARVEQLLRQAAVAQTLREGQWNRGGSFREKLRPAESGPGTATAAPP